MVVGQNIAGVVNDHAGAQTSQLLLELLRRSLPIEKEMEKGFVSKRQHRGADFPSLGNLDMNHGRYVFPSHLGDGGFPAGGRYLWG